MSPNDDPMYKIVGQRAYPPSIRSESRRLLYTAENRAQLMAVAGELARVPMSRQCRRKVDALIERRHSELLRAEIAS